MIREERKKGKGREMIGFKYLIKIKILGNFGIFEM